MLLRALALTLFSLPSALARLQSGSRPLMPPLPLTEDEKHPRTINGERGIMLMPALNTTYYFQQRVDHNDASKGTFTQRYWVDAEWYHTGTSPLVMSAVPGFIKAAPNQGGPIVLATPGESDAEGTYS
jgi:hypothetical protein